VFLLIRESWDLKSNIERNEAATRKKEEWNAFFEYLRWQFFLGFQEIWKGTASGLLVKIITCSLASCVVHFNCSAKNCLDTWVLD
jgi:hypothetical protein